MADEERYGLPVSEDEAFWEAISKQVPDAEYIAETEQWLSANLESPREPDVA